MAAFGRKFIFAMSCLVVVTGFFAYMHYDAETYSRTIVGIAGFFLASQAAVDWVQKPTTTVAK